MFLWQRSYRAKIYIPVSSVRSERERRGGGGNFVYRNRSSPVFFSCARHQTNLTLPLCREGVMEFLLVNHPLDCPICDQGGECDLQVRQ